MKKYEDLYLANSIESLNILAAKSNDVIKNRKLQQLCASADNLHKKIHSALLDEEKTYIYLYRYLLLYEHIHKTIDDKQFVELRFKKDADKVALQLEELRTHLISRYKECADEKALQDTAAKNKIKEEVTNIKPEPIFKNATFITCKQLIDAYIAKKNILVMDARRKEDFEESRLRYIECVNIPEDLISTGLSAHRLGLALPESSKAQWDKRDTYDALIFLDWDTTPENFSTSKLSKLRTILTEWDLNRNYNEKPVVLSGGYIEILQTYPTHCTDPHVVYNRANQDLDELLDLDNIQYPADMDPYSALGMGGPSDETPESGSSSEDSTSENDTRNNILLEEKAIALEKQKVEQNLLELERQWKKIHTNLTEERSPARRRELESAESTIQAVITDLEKTQNELNDKKHELANRYLLYASFKPGQAPVPKDLQNIKELQMMEKESTKNYKILAEMAAERQKILDKARACKSKLRGDTTDEEPRNEKKPRLRPEIDRSNKPKGVQPIYTIEELLQNPNCGMIGLVNLRNTCYMNTILQCLRHLPDIIQFFCSGRYHTQITRKPTTILCDLALVIRSLWSNLNGPFRPTEFYKSVCMLNSTYARGNHEDCMEFFMFLFNQMSDDCATDMEVRGFMSPLQKSWFDQHQGKRSFFIEKFYHQLRITQICGTCKKRTIKYEAENTLMLSLPAQDFTLEQLVDNYLKPYVIPDYVCSHCKGKVLCRKKFCIQPQILVIVLKRYIQEYVSGYMNIRKNKQLARFKLQNFKVGRGFYKLHAIALHSGTLTSGHYSAACLNPLKKTWHEFNDETVSPIDLDDASTMSRACAFFYVLTSRNRPNRSDSEDDLEE